ncbi:MmgE/PrpD family protein [Paraburkholderia phenoliruptrix]|uniref:MmgE/PrpD family protein n=1 Tax=Paraburkholderia phenoliruptrix TaxID=252970 RepID=UPI002869ADE2|nr:MmgE/PrpD family protein [Paraburkholderia phenoliruptrix]WMY10889.1 MmgE/PrpD family protein [Paraburkholderia phenoliruptrix]
MHAITELANFVTDHPEAGLPDDTRRTISLLVLDLIGATAAGLNSPLALAARESVVEAYGHGAISVWLTDRTSSVVGAAMANSAAASALDIDDGHRGAAGHAGAGVIPAALAVAQAIGASRSETFNAIALGYEIALRVATCRPAETVDTYASGRWVAFGAAAATARLLKLSKQQTSHALAIGGSESPIVFTGAVPKFEGTTIKEGIPPAVVAGITAAYRARAGATGPVDMLDDNKRFNRELLAGGLGSTWEAQKCYLKPYACCRYLHAAIDAILTMRQEGADFKELKIYTFPQATRLANERAPKTLEGAQYSFYFSCALAALYGREAIQIVQQECLTDPRVLELAGRLELLPSAEFASAFPAGTPARVVIDQGNGSQEMLVLHPLGDVANPMSPEQLVEKFKRITSTSLNAAQQAGILSGVESLEREGFERLFDVLSFLPQRVVAENETVDCNA